MNVLGFRLLAAALSALLLFSLAAAGPEVADDEAGAIIGGDSDPACLKGTIYFPGASGCASGCNNAQQYGSGGTIANTKTGNAQCCDCGTTPNGQVSCVTTPTGEDP